MKKKLKGTKGITLIALVLTIIVLLILAGVTIATLTGENGILSQAQVSKDSTERAEEKERIQLEVLGSYETDGILSISNLKSNILAHIEGATHDNANNFPLTVTYTTTGHAYKVESDGTVSKKIGVNLKKSSTTLQIVDGVKGEEQLEVELVGITGTVNWSSSDPTKVSVTSLEDTTKVIIRAEAVTTEDVEITASLGGENSVCTVKVEEKKSITGIIFDSTNPSEVNVGSTVQIKVSEIIPEDATEILNWSIAEEDASKATITEVSEDGKTATIRGDSDGTVTIIVQNPKKTLTNNTTNITVKSPRYLAKLADVGDYVDIDLRCSEYAQGWRVLSKTESGENDTVTLISAGKPVQYHYKCDYNGGYYEHALRAFSDMNQIVIENWTDGGFQEDVITGHKSQTGETVNWKDYFTAPYNGKCYKYFDQTKGIHAFGCNSDKDGNIYGTNTEFETLYEYITGKK